MKAWPIAHLRRFLVGASALAMCASVTMAWSNARECNAPGLADASALEAFDLAFRQEYAQARAATLSGMQPIIVVALDNLVLLQGENREEVVVIPPLYHHLKAVSHIPLALFTALAPLKLELLGLERIEDLKHLRELIEAVRQAIGECGFSPEDLKRQQEIAGTSLEFLDGVLAARRFSRQGLLKFTRKMGPLVLANARAAVILEIDGCHKQTTAWKQALGPEAWSRLRVVVLGSQMPRKGNVAVQYFARCLGTDGESRRLVYAEQSSGEQAALNLLATHQLDSEIGVAFFNDPERMERDLLGDAASEYLKTIDIGPAAP
ncbi:MAG TPA: hypothetical protein VGY53_00835 [Isosphaeraceae bacterium]|nr:hypothetical protein [Isosphaeraceae bacterium]